MYPWALRYLALQSPASCSAERVLEYGMPFSPNIATGTVPQNHIPVYEKPMHEHKSVHSRTFHFMFHLCAVLFFNYPNAQKKPVQERTLFFGYPNAQKKPVQERTLFFGEYRVPGLAWLGAGPELSWVSFLRLLAEASATIAHGLRCRKMNG